MSNTPLSEQYERAAREWVDLNAAADLLEETKGATLSQRMSQYADLPVSRAEMLVKSSSEWFDYLEHMVEARKQANLAKVKMEVIRMRFSEWNSYEATERVKARL